MRIICAGFGGIEWDNWDKWDSAADAAAALDVAQARVARACKVSRAKWSPTREQLSCRGMFVPALHGPMLAQPARAVHRTMVRIN